ncbi:MAG: DUF448 domain-containing protein [Alphaproteobacteria bacterium]
MTSRDCCVLRLRRTGWWCRILKKKLPGKGIYVTNSRRLLQKAIEKNLFAKAAKQKAKVAPELDLMVEQLLRKHALDAVSLARKAGVLVTGLEKVLEAIKKG